MTPQEQQDFIQRHVSQIAEHFDCVQILVSRMNENDETETVSMGSGNWHGRIGMAAQMIERNRFLIQRDVKKDYNKDGEDEE